jgi:hypothetical protein
MNSIYRRLGGLAIALLMIPVLIGLLACLPVPIGDPERSRIDADIGGAWLATDEDEILVYLFEPYDKRTWYVAGVVRYEHALDETGKDAETTYEGLIAAIGEQKPRSASGDSPQAFKAWLTRLGKYRFMTWQPLGFVSLSDDPDEMFWYGFRFIKHSSEHFELRMIDSESELFEDVEETRRAYEKVIRKSADNLELYDGVLTFYKLSDQDLLRLNDDW